jgi:hypothetical protein
MTNARSIRWNLAWIAAGTAAWAGLLHSSFFAAAFWMVFPAIWFSAISTWLVCGLAECRPLTRPLLGAIPAAITIPYSNLMSPDPAFGYMPLEMLIGPAALVCLIYLLLAFVRR